MAPPSATETVTQTTPSDGFNTPSAQPAGTAPQEPKLERDATVTQGPSFPAPPKFADPYEEREYLKGRLAAAFRIFGKFGFDEGVAGHITLRDPVEPSTFWVNPFGVAFSLIKRSDLIQVDHHGNIIAGGPCRLLNKAAYLIHSAVHAARPDVTCAAHSHSIHGRSFCALGRPLDIITQDSCAFYNDHVVYEQFNGIVLAEEEGKDIAAALGNRKAALLQNHVRIECDESAVLQMLTFSSTTQGLLTRPLLTVFTWKDAAAAGRGGETVKINEEDAKMLEQFFKLN
ncbi:MAG: hypothetical protein Q9227_005639 [Pyrenula ochraceoflavens]